MQSKTITLLLTVLAAAVFADNKPATTSPAPTPPPCGGPEFRQFDFWIGTWLVRNAAGKEVGKSEITRVSGECAIRENWESGNGNGGMSINYYDPQTTHWNQHWVGSDGAILHLEGGLQEGAMILASEDKRAGKALSNRIAWTRLPDGKVKQEWTTSDDGGKTWTTAFVGFYERR